jgi:hypothetical protein
MSHLHTERLAELADDHPTSAEAEHLAVCTLCARERDAYRSLLQMAVEDRRSLGVPLTQWETLAGALRDEGLVRPEAGGPELVVSSRSRWSAGLLRVAAALLLVAGGAGLGRMTAQTDPAAATSAAAVTQLSTEALLPEYISHEQALAALERLDMAYQHAASFLAEYDSVTYSDDPETFRNRLAALDRVGHTMREALSESPWDPVINSYYMTAMSQRAATMRQLNQALPVQARLVGF